MNKLDIKTRVTILNMLVEGSSMRSISRITGVSINTVTKLLEDAGKACAAYHDVTVRNVKGDMVTTVGWHRMDLLLLGKDASGKRIYQTQAIDDADFLRIKRCVLHGMGFSTLTKHL